MKWDEILDKDDDDDYWVDPAAPTGGRRHRGDGNDNVDGESEEHTHGSEKRTGKGKGARDEKWKG
jgi:hypothetical protein